MSGIVGLFNQDSRPIHQVNFERMVDILKHRGPDGSGVWYGLSIGLGHQKLHTTPESLQEVFPLANRDQSLFLTADARIDNRKELLEVFDIPEKLAIKTTDAELILQAYETWGPKCPEKLIGAFAFAIWDTARRQLFCARDHYGLKPFYYCSIPGRLFALASEIKSLLQLPEVPQELNESAVADHLLAPIDVDATFTFYKNIFRLAPGHSLTVTAEKVIQQQYWALDPSIELSNRTNEDYAEELRAVFTEAVACRTRSAFPIGSMLSGGLDSSAIVATVASLNKRNASKEVLHTYSAVFDHMRQSDERQFINMVLEKYGDGLISNTLAADTLNPLNHYEKMLWHQDSAIQGGNLYFFWNLYQKARKDGVRVIFDGFDGDTTLSHGSGYLHELAHQRQWKTLVHEIRSRSVHWNVSWKRSAWLWFREYEVAPFIRQFPLIGRTRRAVRQIFSRPKQTTKTTTSSLSWQQLLNDRFSTKIYDQVLPPRNRPKTEREDHLYLLNRPVMQRIIEVWESSAAASGLELRLPFCDRRLMEYCLALPPQQKRRDGWSRVSMRYAMEGIPP